MEPVLETLDKVNTVFVPIDNATGEALLAPGEELETFEDDVDIVVQESEQVDVVDLSSIYGPFQRGCLSKLAFQPRDIIFSERARAYVTHDVSSSDPDAGLLERGPDPDFFIKNRELIPSRLLKLKGAPLIALTGILICDQEPLALQCITEGPRSMHGRIHEKKCALPVEAFAAIQDAYFPHFAHDKEKTERWNLQSVGRLYAVVQLNAVQSYIPLSINAYGAGFFPAIALLNHSCNPNAIVTVAPGKCILQACAPIEPGDEITIAYRELPLDLLKPSMIRFIHFEEKIQHEKGCRCEICRSQDPEVAEGDDAPETQEEVEEKITEMGRAFAELELDLSHMWVDKTRQRIKRDKKLMSFVIAMIRFPSAAGGAAAAFALRERYGHLLKYADGTQPVDCNKYCPDLAYVLGDIYCNNTIHVVGQSPANYVWWTDVYIKALMASRVNMPHSIDTALLAKCYACAMSAGSRDSDDVEGHDWDMKMFVGSWVTLRSMHANMYGHTGYLTIPLKAYPILNGLAMALQKEILGYEQTVQLAQIERERKEQELRQANAATVEQRELREPTKEEIPIGDKDSIKNE